MDGINYWNQDEQTDQPQFLFKQISLSTIYRYVQGCLRWSIVERGSNNYTGWVLCYQDGKPITYADSSQPGSISVSASGTYMTL